uniref:pPIWI-associating nuclease domain-containing protein n=1 Tax=Prevotella nigrescens TaxID=28133 RepID=UPI0028898E3F
VAKRIDRELLETMYMETFDEVDILSTHSTIEEYSIQDLTIERITDRDLKCDVQGIVKVRLQYGSNYDIRNDDGYVTDMSFPFNSSFTCTLTEEGIENYVIEQDSIDVDTSSFYE